MIIMVRKAVGDRPGNHDDFSRLSKSYDGHRAVAVFLFRFSRQDLQSPRSKRRREKHHLPHPHYVLTPSSGRAPVFGLDGVRVADRVRQVIGYVPQERAIDRFPHGQGTSRFAGGPLPFAKKRSQQADRRVAHPHRNETHADHPAKTYSGEIKRNLDIACGLLPDPKVLFLDEPTLGLDIQSRLRLWTMSAC